MRIASLLALSLLFGCPSPLETVDPDPGTDGGTDAGSDSATQPDGHGALTGLGLTPYEPSIDVSGHLQFRVDGVYADGFSERLYDGITWSSSDIRVAQIDTSGVAIASAPGTTTIAATHTSGLSASVNLTVIGDTVTLTSVAVTPATVSLWPGDTAQFSANGHYSDGTSGNISGSCGWASSNSGVATVDAGGLVTAVAAGNADISATCAPLTAVKGTVTVTEPDIVLPSPDLVVQSPAVSVLPNGDVHYTATIKNQGDGYAREFYAQIFLNSNNAPTATTPDDAYAWIPGLGAGETVPVSLDVSNPAPGSHKSWITVDLDNRVAESDETNNVAGPLNVTVAAPPVGSADLSFVTSVAFGDSTGVLYSVTVQNTGSVAAPAFYIDLYYDPAFTPTAPIMDWSMIGDQDVHVPGLAPGATYQWEPSESYGPTPTDPWNSCFLLDSMDEVAETSENDNLLCLDVATP